MLKFIMIELLKAYVKNIVPTQKPQKRYSPYFIGFFAITGLILLIITDYIYLNNAIEYVSYIRDLLKISTLFFLLAGFIKIIVMYLDYKKRQQEAEETGLQQIIMGILPTVVSLIPVSVIAYILWSKVQVKLFGKNEKLKEIFQKLL